VSRLLPVHRHPLLGALLLGAACGGNAATRDGGSGAGSSGDAGALAAIGGAPAGGSSGMGGASPGDAGPCHELDPEPNDSRATAVPRETLTDCDDAGSSATGTLGTDADVDVWEFRASDTLGCTVNPTAASTAVARVCLFAACDGLSLSCPDGFAASDSGREGCCQLTPGAVSLQLDCAGTSEDATVWLSVAHDWSVPVSSRDCFDYSVDLHF